MNLLLSPCSQKIRRLYYAQRIIDVFEKDPNTLLNEETINQIFGFAIEAA